MSKLHEYESNRIVGTSNPRQGKIEFGTAHANINISGRVKIERDCLKSSFTLSFLCIVCFIFEAADLLLRG